MSERLVDGKIYGVKRIVKYVCNLGTKELYKIQCIKCGDTRTSPREVIEKEEGCRSCHAKTIKAYSPRRLEQIKKDRESAD